MNAAAARDRLLDWLADVGPRWGVPSDACRVHGLLYLGKREQQSSEISAATGIAEARVRAAIAWLADHQLVEPRGGNGWATGSDPWDLVVRALEVRRQKELAPALDALRRSYSDASTDSILSEQIGKLLRLTEDIAAIDAQARRLSPATLRTLIGFGGRAARFFGGTVG